MNEILSYRNIIVIVYIYLTNQHIEYLFYRRVSIPILIHVLCLVAGSSLAPRRCTCIRPPHHIVTILLFASPSPSSLPQVPPAELEAVIASMTQVKDCIVIPVEDDLAGRFYVVCRRFLSLSHMLIRIRLSALRVDR